ncbi:MAG TPA: hypothetical protein VFW40_00370 [Capsulimonadaceae bacterium]|nr:hypothetical protein [Capsulimonadaceae bacterium]
MEINCEIIIQGREALGVTREHVAAFVGVSKEHYWDAESHGDEAYTFTVGQVLRLCVLLRLSPREVVFESSKAPAQPLALAGNDIIGALRELAGEIEDIEKATGWEAGFLSECLADDTAFGKMPLPALGDLCRSLQVDPLDVLTAYWDAVRLER